MSLLVMLRHGESLANARDAFAGWLDVPLTDRGRLEACAVGRSLAGLRPDAVHTSALDRAVETARLLVEEAGWNLSPRIDWRLNERHYGALQGLDKRAARERYGTEDVERWRRSVNARPPHADNDTLAEQRADERYASIPEAAGVATESLADLAGRMTPYWHGLLAPELGANRTVVVVSHGNALRVLLHLSTGAALEETARARIETAMPITVRPTSAPLRIPVP
ncbi:2,3-bisphosphoglycerate-dependent phosphoglycerate mutase [Sinomonas soli]